MKLFHSPTSPFVRKVMVALHETGQIGDVELTPIAATPLAPSADAVAHNPLGKVPALVRDDGPAIYDSRVICRFLDDRAGAGLYPSSRLWDVLTIEATADGIMDAAVLMTYEARLRPEDKQMPEWVDGQWAKVSRAVEAISQRWISHLSGPLDMGQIALGCALSYLDFRHDARNWRQGQDALARWHATFAARESMQATVPPAA
ncbi:glutathione S-transferase [Actibacterium ureilyticum]|uniref:glutathione S-transferase n=1 Tax=Actibacterium ureilyticum TaxID=1590614 RepID=UPI000BAAF11F|nr:glutathione S-transferase [Actibacterium ureilyticum]